MTVIEEMARAHYDAYAGCYINEPSGPPLWDDMDPTAKSLAINFMRQAIKRLKEVPVTESMVQSCVEVWANYMGNETGQQVTEEFHAILDAMLEQK